MSIVVTKRGKRGLEGESLIMILVSKREVIGRGKREGKESTGEKEGKGGGRMGEDRTRGR